MAAVEADGDDEDENLRRSNRPTPLTESVISLVERHLPNEVLQWHGKPNTIWSFSFFFHRVELVLELRSDGRITASIIDTYLKIPRTQIDPLRSSVREIVTRIDHSVINGRSDKELLIRAWSTVSHSEPIEERETQAALGKKARGWTVDDEQLSWETIINNPMGLELSSVKDTAYHLLGKTPEQLCAQIPSEFRILHVESVLRTDLARSFLKLQLELQQRVQHMSSSKLRKMLPPHSTALSHRNGQGARDEDLIEDMCLPRVTYHGTPLKNVASIVRHGFAMPGTLVNGVPVASPRSGMIFDRGIYSSQSPWYALSYAQGQMQKTPFGEIPSLRLFVCASLMGRTFREDREHRSEKVHGPLQPGYDAHFDGRFEYIVHDARAMLPCYVIHLDLGAKGAQDALKEAQDNLFGFAEKQRKRKIHPKLLKAYVSPGDIKRERDAKKSAALKWFPYGFGSAAGTNFVIEEIGDVSEDEEEYGQWQEERHEYDRESTEQAGATRGGEAGYQFVKTESGHVLDQYQEARDAR